MLKNLFLILGLALTIPLAMEGGTLPFLHPLFADHAVLQRSVGLPVWGWTKPGAAVKVTFAGKAMETKADATGRWEVRYPAMPAGGPYDLKVTDGTARVERGDILIGDVWLLSGQSNMVLGIKETDGGEAAVAAAQHPRMRLYASGGGPEYLPQPATSGTERNKDSWEVCSPEGIMASYWSGFSAIGYHFGRRLLEDLGDVPVGLVLSAQGGTKIEPWISMDGFSGLNDFSDRVNEVTTLADRVKKGEAVSTDPGPNRPAEDRPSMLFNGKIASLAPFPFKGVLWYQGESNGWEPGARYHALLTALIASWRSHIASPDPVLPFIIVQLPNFQKRSDQPEESTWAEVREAQALVAAETPKTALVTIIDIGEADNIHPKNKDEAGRRAALAAEALVYGRANAASGPVYKGMQIEKNKVRLSFDHADGLKIGSGTTLTGFAIAGDDGRFVWGNATLDGKTVVVESPSVTEPKYVRYAWANNPDCNLVNAAGLPACPFRSGK